jgi:hypothetical protein
LSEVDDALMSDLSYVFSRGCVEEKKEAAKLEEKAPVFVDKSESS